jgi:hypothetical protein
MGVIRPPCGRRRTSILQNHADEPEFSGSRAGQSGEERKQFFFEKKNQKTFAYWARACGPSEGVKVFCFFFSKKKTFL